jgi:hypothetical protein
MLFRALTISLITLIIYLLIGLHIVLGGGSEGPIVLRNGREGLSVLQNIFHRRTWFKMRIAGSIEQIK